MLKVNFQDGTKVSNAKVTIDEVDYPVTPARYNGATPLSAYVMNKLQDNIEDAIDQNANNIGGKDYDATSTYDVGDIVKYQGQLYICTTAITTAEAWNSNHWQATDVLSKSKIYVGAEEPVAGEKVWFRKGKNLFDKSNIYNILYNNKTIVGNSAWGMSDFIKVSSNTKYTMSSTLLSGQTTGQIQINEFDESKNYITSTFSNVTLLEFTTNVTTKYLRIGYRVDRQENIMLEQGNYTSYERYIEPQIFVRNSNGVYEEFAKKSEEVYSTEEQVIGKFLGKPLYRRMYEGTTVNVAGGEVITSMAIDNVDKVVKWSGWIQGADVPYALPAPNSRVIKISNTSIRLDFINQGTSTGFARKSYILCVEYTKTTD